MEHPLKGVSCLALLAVTADGGEMDTLEGGEREGRGGKELEVRRRKNGKRW